MRIPNLLKTGITLTMLAAAVATPFTLSGFAHAQAQVASAPATGRTNLSIHAADPNLFPAVVNGKHNKKPKPPIKGGGGGGNNNGGGLEIDPGPIQETTDGNFVSTVYGSKLIANSFYNLTDDNTSCADSINAGIFSIKTDLNGRFEYPFYSLGSSPCSTGKVTITATGTSNDTYTTSVVIDYAHNVTPQIVVEPSTVTSLTTGSFATSVYVYGLAPSTKYKAKDDFNCLTSIDKYYSVFKTDNTGNAEIAWFGGPDFITNDPVCKPGLHTIFVSTQGGNLIYTGHVTLSTIHH